MHCGVPENQAFMFDPDTVLFGDFMPRGDTKEERLLSLLRTMPCTCGAGCPRVSR